MPIPSANSSLPPISIPATTPGTRDLRDTTTFAETLGQVADNTEPNKVRGNRSDRPEGPQENAAKNNAEDEHATDNHQVTDTETNEANDVAPQQENGASDDTNQDSVEVSAAAVAAEIATDDTPIAISTEGTDIVANTETLTVDAEGESPPEEPTNLQQEQTAAAIQPAPAPSLSDGPVEAPAEVASESTTTTTTTNGTTIEEAASIQTTDEQQQATAATVVAAPVVAQANNKSQTSPEPGTKAKAAADSADPVQLDTEATTKNESETAQPIRATTAIERPRSSHSKVEKPNAVQTQETEDETLPAKASPGVELKADADTRSDTGVTDVPEKPAPSSLSFQSLLEKTTASTARQGEQTDQANNDSPRVDSTRFINRVSRAFQAAEQRGGAIRIRLSPPELGALSIELNVQQSTLTAKLETENAAAKSVLLDNLPALRERLAAQEIRIDKFEVDVQQQGSNGQPDWQAHQESRDAQQQAETSQGGRQVRQRGDTVTETISDTQRPDTNHNGQFSAVA